MYWWRVTKYDPRYRDESGRYLRDEWIGAAQIGEEFVDGIDGILTEEEYIRVEGLYAAAVVRFWTASGEPPLQIQALELSSSFGLPSESDELDDVGFGDWRPVNGERVPSARLEAIVRWCLRSLGWCRLVSDEFCVDFGYDFYMSIGTATAIDAARQEVTSSGLFVERTRSPPEPTNRFLVEAHGINDALADDELVNDEWELPGLDGQAIAELWPELPELAGYESRVIDPSAAALVVRYADVSFDFARFTYRLVKR